MSIQRSVDVAIIGAGTAGLVALSQVRRVTDNFVLINGGELGTTCARVGCMPSKAAIQIAEDFHRRHHFDRIGVEGREALRIEVPEAWEHVRDLRDIFVDRVLAGSTDELGDQLIQGFARFTGPDRLEVNGQSLRARKVIIATGSRPYVPEQWKSFADRVLTTDDLFEQETLPASAAVIGLGIIGLEMGQTLHRMGVGVTGIDRLTTVAGLQDPVVSEAAVEILGAEFPIWLGHPVHIEPQADGRLAVARGDRQILVERVVASMGRIPNVDRLGLDALDVECDDRGIPRFNPHTMQVGDLPIFIAGDVTGQRAVLHEAGDEGKIAGYNAVHEPPVAFRRKAPLAITFCDPNIATVGVDWRELDPPSTAVGEVRFGPVGRALIMGKNKGVLRIYARRSTGTVLGAAMIAPRGESLAHLLAWSVQQQLTVQDLLKMPFYHPVIEEALQVALYDAYRQLDLRPVDLPPELSALEAS